MPIPRVAEIVKRVSAAVVGGALLGRSGHRPRRPSALSSRAVALADLGAAAAACAAAAAAAAAAAVVRVGL
eukprot:6354712-Heterocapsa_arctica.AAC.1